ncbi:MAG: hypothetical protein ACJ763_16665 [Bdellovibrionia bacterium]
MKSFNVLVLSLIASLSAASVASAAPAANLQPFFGKYRAIEGDCVQFSGPFRAYVGMDLNHIDLLIREFPSNDASQTTIYMRSGKMPAPGMSPGEFAKGTFVQVTTAVNGAALRSQTVFVKLGRPTGQTVTTLDASQPGYLIRTETSSFVRHPMYCKYQRVQ